MADYLIQESTLDAIADAINAKTGGSSAMTPAQMVTAIGSISGGDDPEEVTLVNSYTTMPTVRTAIQTASGRTNFFCLSLDDVPESGYFLYGGVYIPSMLAGAIGSTRRRTTDGVIGVGGWDSGTANVPAGSKFNVWGVGNYA